MLPSSSMLQETSQSELYHARLADRAQDMEGPQCGEQCTLGGRQLLQVFKYILAIVFQSLLQHLQNVTLHMRHTRFKAGFSTSYNTFPAELRSTSFLSLLNNSILSSHTRHCNRCSRIYQHTRCSLFAYSMVLCSESERSASYPSVFQFLIFNDKHGPQTKRITNACKRIRFQLPKHNRCDFLYLEHLHSWPSWTSHHQRFHHPQEYIMEPRGKHPSFQLTFDQLWTFSNLHVLNIELDFPSDRAIG